MTEKFVDMTGSTPDTTAKLKVYMKGQNFPEGVTVVNVDGIEGAPVPFVVMTQYRDWELAYEAMKAGATNVFCVDEL